MTLNNAELIEDIQAELGESSSESNDLNTYLSDAESCETMEDLKANLDAAKASVGVILDQINAQLLRLQSVPDTTVTTVYDDCTPIDLHTHEFTDDCERV